MSAAHMPAHMDATSTVGKGSGTRPAGHPCQPTTEQQEACQSVRACRYRRVSTVQYINTGAAQCRCSTSADQRKMKP
eukprot:9184607-Pyramimonas_sp.AAC.2